MEERDTSSYRIRVEDAVAADEAAVNGQVMHIAFGRRTSAERDAAPPCALERARFAAALFEGLESTKTQCAP